MRNADVQSTFTTLHRKDEAKQNKIEELTEEIERQTYLIHVYENKCGGVLELADAAVQAVVDKKNQWEQAAPNMQECEIQTELEVYDQED